MQPTAYRILLIDRQPVVRKGGIHMLARTLGVVETSEAGGVEEALEHLQTFGSDLIISEVALPGLGGVDLIKRLVSTKPDVPILAFSSYNESVYAERALRAGAYGFVSKNADEKRFLEAVRRVLNGQIYVSPSVSRHILASMAGERSQGGIDQLSDRELTVFEMIGRGHTRSEIADLLGLSPKTVGSYRARIKSKLELHGGAHLMQVAVQWVKDQP